MPCNILKALKNFAVIQMETPLVILSDALTGVCFPSGA